MDDPETGYWGFQCSKNNECEDCTYIRCTHHENNNYFPCDIQCVRFILNHTNISRNINDTKKLHHIDKNILCSCVLDLAVTPNPLAKATLKFLNGYLHFLLHILTFDVRIFSKHYKLASFASFVTEIWTLKFDLFADISATQCTLQEYVKALFITVRLKWRCRNTRSQFSNVFKTTSQFRAIVFRLGGSPYLSAEFVF